MIKFINLSKEKPYLEFKSKYDKALNLNQKHIEAFSVSSYSTGLNEVNSRYVNLKLIDNKNFIFFSNYYSPKAKEFEEHDQISALLYWDTINTQIRLKANVKKTSNEYNKKYFMGRSLKKNALAISSRQSEPIDSYESVKENYDKSLNFDNLTDCPEYWGGYSITPYYFEFWEGHKSRINKRLVFKNINGSWEQSILQP